MAHSLKKSTKKIFFFNYVFLNIKVRNLFYNRGIFDTELQQQIQRENQKWCDILKRMLHCIKYLAMQNLALRGHRESLQSNANSGNLLGLLKLVSNFDPIVKDHLKFAESHPGSTIFHLTFRTSSFTS